MAAARSRPGHLGRTVIPNHLSQKRAACIALVGAAVAKRAVSSAVPTVDVIITAMGDLDGMRPLTVARFPGEAGGGVKRLIEVGRVVC